MKVYFAGSIYYRNKFVETYKRIVAVLKEEKYQVFEHALKMTVDEYGSLDEDKGGVSYKEIVKWIDQADFVVIEGSFPSTLHIGLEISLVLEKNKPVIILYKKGCKPLIFHAVKNDRLIWAEYNDNNDVKAVLLEAIEKAKKEADVRFNFFVSPEILAYMDWVAQKRMIPRSVFLRDLIEKEMKKDKEFKG
jgi:hypothetical protein